MSSMSDISFGEISRADVAEDYAYAGGTSCCVY